MHRLLIRARAMIRGKIWTIGRADPPIVRTYTIPDDQTTTVDLETGACIDAEKRERLRMTEPVVTFTMTVDRAGNITNDTQTHGNTFAQVYRAFHSIRDEVQRQIDQRRACPFNPLHGTEEPVFPDDQK